jgi:hypothetical protein
VDDGAPRVARQELTRQGSQSLPPPGRQSERPALRSQLPRKSLTDPG